MTWAEFTALLSGLSAESRWMLALRADADEERDVRVIEDPDAAVAYMRSQFGG